MTIVRICTVDPLAPFVTRVNGKATLEQLHQAEKELQENFDNFNIPSDVWNIEAKLFDDGNGAYFGEIRHLSKL